IGAAVGGWATYYMQTDISLALLVGGAAGALAAIVVGYPALRRRGLTLAVSTPAFAPFVSSFLLNQELVGQNGRPAAVFPGPRPAGVPLRPLRGVRALRRRERAPLLLPLSHRARPCAPRRAGSATEPYRPGPDRDP